MTNKKIKIGFTVFLVILLIGILALFPSGLANYSTTEFISVFWVTISLYLLSILFVPIFKKIQTPLFTFALGFFSSWIWFWSASTDQSAAFLIFKLIFGAILPAFIIYIAVSKELLALIKYHAVNSPTNNKLIDETSKEFNLRLERVQKIKELWKLSFLIAGGFRSLEQSDNTGLLANEAAAYGKIADKKVMLKPEIIDGFPTIDKEGISNLLFMQSFYLDEKVELPNFFLTNTDYRKTNLIDPQVKYNPNFKKLIEPEAFKFGRFFVFSPSLDKEILKKRIEPALEGLEKIVSKHALDFVICEDNVLCFQKTYDDYLYDWTPEDVEKVIKTLSKIADKLS